MKSYNILARLSPRRVGSCQPSDSTTDTLKLHSGWQVEVYIELVEIPRLPKGGLLPQEIEADIGLHQLFPAGEILGNVAKEQVEQALTVLFRAHQGRFALNAHRLRRIFDGGAKVADLVDQLQGQCLFAGPYFAVGQRQFATEE